MTSKPSYGWKDLLTDAAIIAVAAGIVLVKESGGFVTDFKGRNEYIVNKTILVTNSKINNEMMEVLK